MRRGAVAYDGRQNNVGHSIQHRFDCSWSAYPSDKTFGYLCLVGRTWGVAAQCSTRRRAPWHAPGCGSVEQMFTCIQESIRAYVHVHVWVHVHVQKVWRLISGVSGRKHNYIQACTHKPPEPALCMLNCAKIAIIYAVRYANACELK